MSKYRDGVIDSVRQVYVVENIITIISFNKLTIVITCNLTIVNNYTNKETNRFIESWFHVFC